MSKIPYVWFKNATDADKTEIENLLRNNTRLNRLLLSILSDYYEEIEKRGDKEDDYKEAGILALLAFRNGQMSMLKKVAGLYDFMTKEGT